MSAENPNRPLQEEQQQFTSHDEWYRSFLANTSQKAVQKETLNRTLQNEYPDLWNKITDPQYPFSLLLIGAGTGESEIAFAADIKNTRATGLSKVSIYYEDVSSQMHERFRGTTKGFGINDSVIAHYLEAFEDDSFIPPAADLTLGFQMWYYVGDWQGVELENNSLLKLVSTVQERKGLAMLSMQSRRGDLHAIRGPRIPILHGHQDLVSEDVEKELERLGITFRAKQVDSVTDVNSFFQNGDFDPSLEGKNILSFMLRKDWNSLTMGQQRGVANDVLALTERNGGQHLVFRDRFILIPGDQNLAA
jgi:hypothetical protein